MIQQHVYMLATLSFCNSNSISNAVNLIYLGIDFIEWYQFILKLAVSRQNSKKLHEYQTCEVLLC